MEKKFEFIGYQPVLNDQYMTGIASVKVYGKIVLRYKEVKTKDGNGFFYTFSNYTITNPNTQEKKYIQPVLIDSRAEEEELIEFVREGVRRAKSPSSVFTPASQSVHTSQGVAANEQLPF